jgi:hypothetical protein
MMICAKEPKTGEFTLCVGAGGTELRIPRMESAAHSIFLEEELISYLHDHSASIWILDLSEHEDGITLALARVLARFREEARRRGCEVIFKGLGRGIVSCLE